MVLEYRHSQYPRVHYDYMIDLCDGGTDVTHFDAQPESRAVSSKTILMKKQLNKLGVATASRRLILFLFLLLSPVTQAAGALTPFKVSYDVDYSIASGVMTLTLSENDNGRFVFDSITEAQGAAKFIIGKPVKEHATFEINDGKVRATGYRLDDGNKKSNKSAQIEYDWAAAQAAMQSEDGDESRPLDSGTMDQLVMQAAAILEVKEGNKQFSFTQIKPGRKLEAYVYEYLGDETLQTGIGELKTVKYSRAKKGADKTTHYWFAIDHDYTPVKLQRIKKDRTVFTATLISLEL